MPQVNHNVEILGWGETAAGVKYWIGRNSWGTYWGEGGFFRLGRGYGMDKNLRVERDCQWMVPEWGDLDKMLNGAHRDSWPLKPLFCMHVRIESSCTLLECDAGEYSGDYNHGLLPVSGDHYDNHPIPSHKPSEDSPRDYLQTA